MEKLLFIKSSTKPRVIKSFTERKCSTFNKIAIINKTKKNQFYVFIVCLSQRSFL